ncbi:MAG: hypothetical protein Ct9H300mP16_02230 [Pseudomonadota bacterium]|nr:MAG: hypothetical protein Ct9H300mP16_02230 [Pseudomonadota bacterium]
MGDAFKTFLLVPLLIPFTLGLLIPYFSFRGWRFAVSHSALGRQGFAFASARVGAYYRAFFAIGLLVVVLVILFGGLLALLLLLFAPGTFAAGAERAGLTGLMTLLPVLLMAVLYLVAIPGYRVMTRNVSLNSAKLGPHSFESTLEVWPVVWIYASNAACIIFSAGLLTPWARVRVARYLAGHLVLNAVEDLESFVQAQIWNTPVRSAKKRPILWISISAASDGVLGRLLRRQDFGKRKRLLRLTDEQHITLVSDDGETRYRIQDLVVSRRLGRTSRRVEMPDGVVCEISDNDAVDLGARYIGQPGSRPIGGPPGVQPPLRRLRLRADGSFPVGRDRLRHSSDGAACR